ncbi:hypothetical protein DWB68_06265 [Galactobacter valiniphilus]|uniref:Uncharacterized protein n=1 Tax=Galactobacter valiniphilus TaxID=2676122 RepID=A0A399JAD4_9MICC|nr:hypothetical protein [Galactobacter valiniphilus]RII42551.1 hypothetical protein DWB68_06265 [Galactobacter valiniphilus]
MKWFLRVAVDWLGVDRVEDTELPLVAAVIGIPDELIEILSGPAGSGVVVVAMEDSGRVRARIPVHEPWALAAQVWAVQLDLAED